MGKFRADTSTESSIMKPYTHWILDLYSYLVKTSLYKEAALSQLGRLFYFTQPQQTILQGSTKQYPARTP